jgi:hypothetical protein
LYVHICIGLPCGLVIEIVVMILGTISTAYYLFVLISIQLTNSVQVGHFHTWCWGQRLYVLAPHPGRRLAQLDYTASMFFPKTFENQTPGSRSAVRMTSDGLSSNTPKAESSNKRKATEMEDDAPIKLEDSRGSQARLEKDAHILNGENDDTKSLAKQLTQLTNAVAQLTASSKQVQDHFQKVAKEQSKEISSLKDLIRELRETVTSLKSSQRAAQGYVSSSTCCDDGC